MSDGGKVAGGAGSRSRTRGTRHVQVSRRVQWRGPMSLPTAQICNAVLACVGRMRSNSPQRCHRSLGGRAMIGRE